MFLTGVDCAVVVGDFLKPGSLSPIPSKVFSRSVTSTYLGNKTLETYAIDSAMVYTALAVSKIDSTKKKVQTLNLAIIKA